MTWCSKCFLDMQGIVDRKMRDTCYACGGSALTDASWKADRDVALERMKAAGLIREDYQFRGAS